MFKGRYVARILETAALVIIAVVSISPTGFRDQPDARREVASVSNGKLDLYSRATLNRTAPYNPVLLNARVEFLAQNQRRQQERNMRLISEPSESFADLQPSVMGSSLLQEMELAVLGVQQTQQIFDLQLSTIMQNNNNAFAAGVDPNANMFSTKGDRLPMQASWIGTHAGTRAWGANDSAFTSRRAHGSAAMGGAINRAEVGKPVQTAR